MHPCFLCPRNCGVDRFKKSGYCGAKSRVKLSRATLHMWEEPCISGTRGSGTVFFSGCQLKCCFCQNYTISTENFGKEISINHLSDIFLRLESEGAHNINLVSPTPYVYHIMRALDKIRHKLSIPIIYNSGGYENVETIRLLSGYIDIYLPDLKYKDPARSLRYSKTPNYYAVATEAIRAMYESVGPVLFDKNGLLKKGLIIRHLVMPGGRHDSIAIMQDIAALPFSQNILISVMSQFTPFFKSAEYPEINRRITSLEYDAVVDMMIKLGLTHGYMQKRSSAKKEYTPPFNLEGV